MFSVKAKLFSFFVFGLGLGSLFLLGDFDSVSSMSLLELFTFLVISLLIEHFPVKMPLLGYVTVNFAIDFAVLLIFGPTSAAAVAVVSYLLFCLLHYRQELSIWKVFFNTGQFSVAIFVSGYVFSKSGGVFGSFNHNGMFFPAMLAILAYLFVNTVFMAVMFSLIKRISIFRSWFSGIKWVVPNYLALGALGYIFGFIYSFMHTLGVVILFVPLLLARHTFKLYMDMREMYLKTIQSLASTIDAKDHYTAGHSERVAQYVVSICEEMDLPDKYIENIKDIALLHDIGKIGIPESILNKPGRLDDWEMDTMKTHSTVGYDIVKQITFIKEPEVLKYHHERIDGKGYPDGLKGEEIPQGARIIAVADSFDAMTTDRPYRKGMDLFLALKELERCQGTQFDPQVVAAFINSFSKKMGNENFLSDSELRLLKKKTEG